MTDMQGSKFEYVFVLLCYRSTGDLVDFLNGELGGRCRRTGA
jgi:hypothetical protein